jgi:hypothetical protein
MKVERICVLVSFLVTNEKLLKNLSDIFEFQVKKKIKLIESCTVWNVKG